MMSLFPFRNQLYALAVVLAFSLGIDDLAVHPYNPDSPTFLSHYVRQGIEYALLNGLYLIWLIKAIRLRSTQPEEQTAHHFAQNFRPLIQPGLLFLFAAWIAYPNTGDPYGYLHFGKMVWSGYNPYLTPGGDFTSQFSPFLAWFQTSTYGVVSLGVFMLVTAGSVLSVTGSIYFLKTLFLLLHLVNTYLIWNATKLSHSRALITLAYFINPILLFEQVGNARVDILLCTTLILLTHSLRKGHYVNAVIAMLLGIFSKTLPVIWVAQLGVFLMRSKRWKSIGISACWAIAFFFILSQTVFTEPKAWLSLLNPGVVWQTAGSFHDILNNALTIAKPFLPSFISENQGRLVRLFKLLTYFLYCVGYAWMCGRAYFSKKYVASSLVLEMGWSTLILFLFATPWYQPWYATILLCFVALMNFTAPRFCLIALTYSTCSAIAYYIFSGVVNPAALLIASIITVFPTTALLCLSSRWIFSEIQAVKDLALSKSS
jgi:alpha-1,6-mannosyltransferase